MPLRLFALLAWLQWSAASPCDSVRRVEERWVESEELFEELRPDFCFAHLGLDQHIRHGLAQDGSTCFNALYNKAAALQGSLQLDEAEAVWKQAVAAAKGEDETSSSLHRLGVVQHSLGRNREALQTLTNSILVFAKRPAAWLRLGLILHGMQGPSEAARAMFTAVRLLADRSYQPPDSHVGGALCYYILQETLREAMDVDKALTVVREGSRRYPGRRELLCREVVAALHVCDWRGYQAMAEGLAIVMARGGAGMLNCLTPWDSLYVPLDYSHITQIASAHARDLLRLIGAEGLSLRTELRRNWPVSLALSPEIARQPRLSRAGIGGMGSGKGGLGPDAGSQVLRVGYVSSHLNRWACGRDMVHVLRLHDRRKVHTVCYALAVEPPGGRGLEWQTRVREQCGEWVEGQGLSDVQLAKQINQDQIHVLVNLNGWIQGHRSAVLAMLPAPVQVGYKDFPGSFGAGTRGMSGGPAIVSHILVDAVAKGQRDLTLPHAGRTSSTVAPTPRPAPPELSRLYGEALVLLPRSFHANAHQYLHAPAPKSGGGLRSLRDRAEQHGAPRARVLLANFNSLYKLSPAAWHAWRRVLVRCGSACALWMLRWSEAGAKILEAKTKRDWNKTNVKKNSNRADMTRPQPAVEASRQRNVDEQGGGVVLTELLPEDEHVQVKGGVDVFLDTPAYNAHGTLADALWMRTPAVSVAGISLASRIGASMLRAAGRGGDVLLARDMADYEQVAVRLARSEVWRKRVRAMLELEEPMHAWREAEAGVRDANAGVEAWSCKPRGGGEDGKSGESESGGRAMMAETCPTQDGGDSEQDREQDRDRHRDRVEVKDLGQREGAPENRLFDLTRTVDSLERALRALWELHACVGSASQHHLLVAEHARS